MSKDSQYRLILEEIDFWLSPDRSDPRLGLAQVIAFVKRKKPSKDLAFLIYEKIADLRSSESFSIPTEDIEIALDGIRQFISQ